MVELDPQRERDGLSCSSKIIQQPSPVNLVKLCNGRARNQLCRGEAEQLLQPSVRLTCCHLRCSHGPQWTQRCSRGMRALEGTDPEVASWSSNRCVLAVAWATFCPMNQGCQSLAEVVQSLRVGPEHVTADRLVYQVEPDRVLTRPRLSLISACPALVIREGPEHPQRGFQRQDARYRMEQRTPPSLVDACREVREQASEVEGGPASEATCHQSLARPTLLQEPC